MLERPAAVGRRGGSHPALRRAPARLLGGVDEGVGQRLVALGDEGREQLVAGGEVAVHRGPRHPHRLRDPVEGQRRRAALGDLGVPVLADVGERLRPQAGTACGSGGGAMTRNRNRFVMLLEPSNERDLMNSPTTLTEVVLPGVVEPDGLIIQERPVPTPGERPGAGRDAGRRRLVRRAGHAPQPLPRPAEVPVRARLRPRRRRRRGGRRRGSGAGGPARRGGHEVRRVDDARAARRPHARPGPRRRRRRPRRRPSWSTASPPGRCCTARPASGRARRSSSTAPTAASAPRWSSWPATPGSGSSAPRRPATTTRCASWAPSRSTTTTRGCADRVRELAPDGVAAAFDHLGGAELQALLRPAGARRHAGRLRHREPARRHQQPGAVLHRALRPARAVEPAPQRPPRPLLQLLGRQARAAQAVPPAPARPTSRACCRCCETAPSPRRSPRTSRCATPARR